MKHAMMTQRRAPDLAVPIVVAGLVAGCTPPRVPVQVEYNVGTEAACPEEVTLPGAAPAAPAPPGAPKSKVCTWIDGKLDRAGFVDGPASVDVYIANENPFCTSYKASLSTGNYTPPPPISGAIYGAAAAGAAGAAGAGAASPVAAANGTAADAQSIPVIDRSPNPDVKEVQGDVRRAMTTVAGRLKKAYQDLTILRFHLNYTARAIDAIAQECKPSPDPAKKLSPEEVLEDQKKRAAHLLQGGNAKEALLESLSLASAEIDSTDAILLSAPATAKEIEAYAVRGLEALPKDAKGKPNEAEAAKYRALVEVAGKLAEEAAALSAQASALRAMQDTIVRGTQVVSTTQVVSGTQVVNGAQVLTGAAAEDSLVSVIKSLDGLQATLNKANAGGSKPDKSQQIDTYQTITIDLADGRAGGRDSVQKVTLHTLSPLYVDVGVGPAWIFNNTQTWTVATTPGSTVGMVTHSDAPNFDGMVSLSGYVYGPRYYDGSLRSTPRQWIPRPMVGLSMKSAFSSVYLGAQIDPVQFVDITVGAYLYSRSEPVNARDGAVVPSGALATNNVFAVSGFFSITSSVNLFAGWITGAAKSP
jgi:hypothetical protein